MTYIVSSAAGLQHGGPYTPAAATGGMSYENAQREEIYWTAKANEPGVAGALAAIKAAEIAAAVDEFEAAVGN